MELPRGVYQYVRKVVDGMLTKVSGPPPLVEAHGEMKRN